MEEPVDPYTRSLKSFIWNRICTKEYTSVLHAMMDEKGVDSAYIRGGSGKLGRSAGGHRQNKEPIPMKVSNVKLERLNLKA